MSDFESWEEVEEYLQESDNNSVNYHTWTFAKDWMSCGDWDCCSDNFDSVEDAIISIQRYSSNRLELVTKDE